MKTPHKTSGFTLIEILVSLVVLSLGLLGIMAMQMNSLQVNQLATDRTQATLSAIDIIDRMRANPTVALAESYDIDLDTSTPDAGATLVSQDLNEWRTSLSNWLPEGTGSVDVDGNIVTVVIQWNESRARGGEETHQFTIETQL